MGHTKPRSQGGDQHLVGSVTVLPVFVDPAMVTVLLMTIVCGHSLPVPPQ
jgi:hypothetical protein